MHTTAHTHTHQQVSCKIDKLNLEPSYVGELGTAAKHTELLQNEHILPSHGLFYDVNTNSVVLEV